MPQLTHNRVLNFLAAAFIRVNRVIKTFKYCMLAGVRAGRRESDREREREREQYLDRSAQLSDERKIEHWQAARLSTSLVTYVELRREVRATKSK